MPHTCAATCPALQGAALVTGPTVVSVDEIFVSGLKYVILSRSVSRSKLFILGSLKPEDFTPVMPLLGDMSPERVAGLPPQLRAFLEAMKAPAEAQQPPELHSRYKDAAHDQAARSAAVASGAEDAAAQAAAAKAIEDTACKLCGDTEDEASMLLCRAPRLLAVKFVRVLVSQLRLPPYLCCCAMAATAATA
jgi:hypothetical protein